MKNYTVLIDHLVALLKLKNDAALAAVLGVARPVISKLRAGTLLLGATLIVRINQASEMSVADIRAMAAVLTKGDVMDNLAAAAVRGVAKRSAAA